MEKNGKKITQLKWTKYQKPNDKNMGWMKQKFINIPFKTFKNALFSPGALDRVLLITEFIQNDQGMWFWICIFNMIFCEQIHLKILHIKVVVFLHAFLQHVASFDAF